MRPTPPVTDLSEVTGPFDIVGDVHGCYDTLTALLTRLGYDSDGGHPDGRLAVFVGDVVDHGPRSGRTLHLVRRLVLAGRALTVRGNHEVGYSRRMRERGNGSGELAEWLEALPNPHTLSAKGPTCNGSLLRSSSFFGRSVAVR